MGQRGELTMKLVPDFLFRPPLCTIHPFSSSKSDASSFDRYSFTVCQPNSLLSANLIAFIRLDTILCLPLRRLSLSCMTLTFWPHRTCPAPQARDQAAVGFLSSCMCNFHNERAFFMACSTVALFSSEKLC